MSGLDVDQVRNFFDGIRYHKSLRSDIQDSAISTMICHLGNMAQDVGETLVIDPKTARVLNNNKAMESWKRSYEHGWEPRL